MTTPTTTVFKAKVTNKLNDKPIFVQLQAELHNETHVTTSEVEEQKNERDYSKTGTKEWNKGKDKGRKTSLVLEESKTDKTDYSHSDDNDDLLHDKSAKSNALKKLFGLDSVDVSSAKDKKQQSAMNEKAPSDKQSNSELDTESKEFGQNDAAKNILPNVIEPGFVRIAPLQSMSIPVIAAYEAQVVYLTVYTKTESGNKLFISNGLQLDTVKPQNVEIDENAKSGFIEIKLSSNTNSKFKLFRSFLSKWGIPDFLQDAMQNAGWHDMSSWNELTEEDLVSMGFKRGHRVLLLSKYKQYLKKKNKIKTDIDCTHLLKSWNLPKSLTKNMIEKGWDDIELWDKISDDELRDMAFENGHIVKFRKHLENDNHLKEFDALKESLKSNKIFIDSMSDR